MEPTLDDATQPIAADTLSNLFEQCKSHHSKDNQLRLRRSISWLNLAQSQHSEFDFDASFIFHWISFNSMYALPDLEDDATSDSTRYREFLTSIAQLDTRKDTIAVLQPLYAATIFPLVQNRYIYPTYWKHDFDKEKRQQTDHKWEYVREKNLKNIKQAVGSRKRANPAATLHCIFDLIYSVRNQLLHGSSTYFGSVNREQVQTGATILNHVIPCFVSLMLEHPTTDWGTPPFPPHEHL